MGKWMDLAAKLEAASDTGDNRDIRDDSFSGDGIEGGGSKGQCVDARMSAKDGLQTDRS